MSGLAFCTTREQMADGAFSALLLRQMVSRRMKNLTDSEYTAAIEYTARKYHLPQRAGHLDLDHISIGRMDYIAEIVAEAVGQDRLSRSTLEIARNDREIETSGKQERNETA